MVATDGHRLALVSKSMEVPGVDLEVRALIPRKTLVEIQKLIGEQDSMVEFGRDENHLFFAVGGKRLVSRILAGQFPNYELVMPRDNDKYIVSSTRAFGDGIRRAAIMSDEKLRAIRLSFKTGTLELTASSADAGEAREVVPVEYEGDSLDIGFNPQYLLDFVGSLRVGCDLHFSQGFRNPGLASAGWSVGSGLPVCRHADEILGCSSPNSDSSIIAISRNWNYPPRAEPICFPDRTAREKPIFWNRFTCWLTARASALQLQRTAFSTSKAECCVEGTVAHGSLTRDLKIHINREEKKLFVLGKPARLDEFVGNLHLLAFTHEHLKVVRGGPADRRAFLDRAMVTLYPGHVAQLAAYERALKQRNRVLAAAREGRSQVDTKLLDSWDEALVESRGQDFVESKALCGADERGTARRDCSEPKS